MGAANAARNAVRIQPTDLAGWLADPARLTLGTMI
jgi:hypothetical protein